MTSDLIFSDLVGGTKLIYMQEGSVPIQLLPNFKRTLTQIFMQRLKFLLNHIGNFEHYRAAYQSTRMPNKKIHLMNSQ